MAESGAKILISIGREKYTLQHKEGMTFGDVRAEVVSLSGLNGESFRFLCKGRATKDDEKVCVGSPPSLVKVMALKTKKFHQDSATAVRSGSSSVHLASALEAAEEKEERRAAVTKILAMQPTQPKGDTISERESFVMVRVARERYHIRIDLSSNIAALKQRLETMEGITASARNMNLIFGGKQRKDDEVLKDIGVKRGSMFVLLFLARHHDTVEARSDLQKIKDALVNLESRAVQIGLQFDRRLMDPVEVRARLSEIEGEAGVLKNQLLSNKCEDDSRKVVQTCMQNAERAIGSVRGKLS